jgi:hypothetical protein
MDDGERKIGKGFEDSLRRGFGCAFSRIFRVQSHELIPCFPKAPAHHEFDEGKQPESDAEKVDEPSDLIVSFDKDRVQGKRRALESMESPFDEPFVAVCLDGFFKRQLILSTVRCISTPSQRFLESGDSFLPTLHVGDFVADFANGARGRSLPLRPRPT